MFQQCVYPHFEGKEEYSYFYKGALHIVVWNHNSLFLFFQS